MVTGFQGRGYGIAQSWTGCAHVLVVPQAKPDGSLTESAWCDITRLAVVAA